MQEFAGILAMGALAQGATVFLGGNEATVACQQAVKDAATARGISVYF